MTYRGLFLCHNPPLLEELNIGNRTKSLLLLTQNYKPSINSHKDLDF